MATIGKQEANMEVCSTNSPTSSGSSGCATGTSPEWAGNKDIALPPSTGLFRRGGIIPTAICLSKAAIGAGVLSMAAHAAEVGLAFQGIGLAVGALLTLVSIQMIARASVQTGGWSYEDICEELFHPAMSLVTGFVNVCNCLGSGAGYLIVCGQVFQVVTGTGEGARQLFVLLVGLLVCAPMALARHVSFMRHLAAWSVAALMLLVLVVVIFFAENGPDETVTEETFWLGPGSASIFGYMNSLNTIVFAYNNQFNVPQLTGELTPEPSTRSMSIVAASTVTLCFALFSAVSVFGVLAFGVGDRQMDSLVLDLMPDRRNPVVVAALVGVMFSVITCFQFHIYPIRQFFGYIAKKYQPAIIAKDEAAFGGRTAARWVDIVSALASVVLIIFIALVVTSLKTVLDFVGAFASAWISYVVPPLWQIQLLRKHKDFSWFSLKTLGCMALFSLGVFLFVFGTFSAIRGAMEG